MLSKFVIVFLSRSRHLLISWLPSLSALIVEPKKIKEEKRTTEDEIAEWHHRLDGHEFEQAPGVGDGEGSLAWYSSWGRKELDTLSDWTEENKICHCFHFSPLYFPWSEEEVKSALMKVKEQSQKEGIYTHTYTYLNHFAIHQKLTQHSKSAELQ